MESTIERIVQRTRRGVIRDIAVSMVLKLAARGREDESSLNSEGCELSQPYPVGILFSPEAAVPVLGRMHGLGYGYVEAGPLRAARDASLAEVARAYRERLERRLRSLPNRPRLSIRLGLPPVLEHHAFLADVVLAYRRIYPVADWIVIDALDALVRPWSPQPHRFILEPLMASLQEWNRHYVLKPLILRVPVPVGGHVRELLGDLASRRLVSGVVLASGWRQVPVPVSVFVEGIAAVRSAVGRDIPITVEASEEIAQSVCALVGGEVMALVDPLSGMDEARAEGHPAAPDRFVRGEEQSGGFDV